MLEVKKNNEYHGAGWFLGVMVQEKNDPFNKSLVPNLNLSQCWLVAGDWMSSWLPELVGSVLPHRKCIQSFLFSLYCWCSRYHPPSFIIPDPVAIRRHWHASHHHA